MQETSKYTVFNIREYLGDGSHGLGEDTLFQVLSEFSCKINPDVERFIKKQSVEFAKKTTVGYISGIFNRRCRAGGIFCTHNQTDYHKRKTIQ